MCRISGFNIMAVPLPKISIITPSFNQGAYLEETILSIVNQSYSNYELIIIDAGSTDSTLEVIHKYESSITYWVSEPDRGQSHAIQKGLAKVTGDIVNWINSDDLLAPGALQEIADNFDLHDFDVFCGRCDYFVNEVGNWDLRGLRMGLSATVGDTLLAGKITQPSTFFKTSVFRELGVNEKFHFTMDVDLWYRYLLLSGQKRVSLSDKVLAYFRLHESSKTVSMSSKFLEDLSMVTYNILSSLNQPSELLNFAASQISEKKFHPTSYTVKVPEAELDSFIRSSAWSAVIYYNTTNNRTAARACLQIALKHGHPLNSPMLRQLVKQYIIPSALLSK